MEGGSRPPKGAPDSSVPPPVRHAKTGTFGESDRVGPGVMVNGKGLAGYIDTKDGRRLAFAIYINNTHVTKNADVQGIVGQAIGESWRLVERADLDVSVGHPVAMILEADHALGGFAVAGPLVEFRRLDLGGPIRAA